MELRRRLAEFAGRRFGLLYSLRLAAAGYQLVALDYRVTPRPRYGYGAPPHEQIYALLDRERARYAELLDSFAPFHEDLVAIPLESTSVNEPCWLNDWFSGLDSIALYCFLRLRAPERYFEVGSGYSTQFARRAVTDHGSSTRIVSVDPSPRAEIDLICEEIVRERLEDVDLTLFDELDGGDVCFFDGSHRCFMNSDATVALLELLPRFRPGVLVGIHDVYLPYDYPPDWSDRFYSEQYVLAAYLLGGMQSFDVKLPGAFVSGERELGRALEPIWKSGPMSSVPRDGTTFWIETR